MSKRFTHNISIKVTEDVNYFLKDLNANKFIRELIEQSLQYNQYLKIHNL